MYAQSAREKRGLGKLITRHQAVLIWILVWLQGFTLKIDSISFLVRNRERATSRPCFWRFTSCCGSSCRRSCSAFRRRSSTMR